MTAGKKVRLDLRLVEKGLADSRSKAQAFILAGQVSVSGSRQDKPGTLIAPDAPINLATGPRFVSRGGEKLAAALDSFKINVAGKVCLDIGASTGGFTDCLLQNGAVTVYALDVGWGQLDPKIRKDPRVVVIEKTNIRKATPNLFPKPVDLITIDVSFISLTKVLPKVREILIPSSPPCPSSGTSPRRGEGGRRPGEGEAQVIALIKPQFEVGPRQAKKGVVRDPKVHEEVITCVKEEAGRHGFQIKGVIPSPLIGPKGNREFLILLES